MCAGLSSGLYEITLRAGFAYCSHMDRPHKVLVRREACEEVL